jgi:hypothetical protein
MVLNYDSWCLIDNNIHFSNDALVSKLLRKVTLREIHTL